MVEFGDVRITNVGDTAFNVEFGNSVDRQINAKVMSLYEAVKRRHAEDPLPGLVEIIPTFRSLLISYDVCVTTRSAMVRHIHELLAQERGAFSSSARRWRIPVCYDGELGPDVEDVCQACGLSRDAVIALHSGAEYFVYMIGFMPGFAYLGGVPEPLRLPRRLSPRVKVPAGSVAIAEELSAVYPWESPGGWHLLGRSPVSFFDMRRDPPVLLRAGDLVYFRPIERSEYDALSADASLLDPASLLMETR
jgi:KipI family sensor histidine kinase inhibitor